MSQNPGQDAPALRATVETTEVDGVIEVTAGEVWHEWHDDVPDAYDEWLTLGSGVVTWTPPPETAEGPCAPETALTTDRIRTKVGVLAIDTVPIGACLYGDAFAPGRISGLVSPLGKDWTDVQVANAGVVHKDGHLESWSSDMWAVRVAGVLSEGRSRTAPRRGIPWLHRWPRPEVPSADGGRPPHLGDDSPRLGGLPLVFRQRRGVGDHASSFGCELPVRKTAAAHAALGKHLRKAWQQD